MSLCFTFFDELFLSACVLFILADQLMPNWTGERDSRAGRTARPTTTITTTTTTTFFLPPFFWVEGDGSEGQQPLTPARALAVLYVCCCCMCKTRRIARRSVQKDKNVQGGPRTFVGFCCVCVALAAPERTMHKSVLITVPLSCLSLVLLQKGEK